MRPAMISCNAAQIVAAIEKIGQKEFDRLAGERKLDGWPKRSGTDTQDYFNRCVQTHLDCVRLEVAREVLES